MIRIVVAAGYEIVQYGLLAILQSEASFRVIAVAQQGAEALKACRTLRPDLLLLNLRLPDGDGLSVARQVSALPDGPRVLICSAFPDAVLVRAALEARVHGYLLQTASADAVRGAIKRVMRGEQVLVDVTPPANGTGVSLSAQEAVVLRYIAEGVRTREIARQMSCGPRTVEEYLTRIFDKLGVNTRRDAVSLARRQGMLAME